MSGQSSTSNDDQHVEKVHEVIRSNRRLTMQEVTDKVVISKTSSHEILIENLGIQRVTAKFVPRLLSDEQKQTRLEVSQGIFYRANNNENFLRTSLPVARHGLMDMMSEPKV